MCDGAVAFPTEICKYLIQIYYKMFLKIIVNMFGFLIN